MRLYNSFMYTQMDNQSQFSDSKNSISRYSQHMQADTSIILENMCIAYKAKSPNGRVLGNIITNPSQSGNTFISTTCILNQSKLLKKMQPEVVKHFDASQVCAA